MAHLTINNDYLFFFLADSLNINRAFSLISYLSEDMTHLVAVNLSLLDYYQI